MGKLFKFLSLKVKEPETPHIAVQSLIHLSNSYKVPTRMKKGAATHSINTLSGKWSVCQQGIQGREGWKRVRFKQPILFINFSSKNGLIYPINLLNVNIKCELT